MRWRMDGAVQQFCAVFGQLLRPGIAQTVYPVWFENAAPRARDQEG